MISLTSKALSKRTAGSRPYSVYVYPNIGRKLMGSNNPYIQHLKEAIGRNALDIDSAVSDKAFPDLLRKGFRSDMIILNWLENLPLRRMGILQTVIAMIYIRLLRIKGTKIVWIKHNKISHSKKWFAISKMIQRTLSRCAHHIVTHSQDIDIAETNKLLYLPHPSNIGPEAVLAPATDEKPVIDLLIWGSILPYKGVLEFLQFAEKDAGLRRLNIHIVGKCAADYWELLQKYRGDNLTMRNEFIEEEELIQLFKRTRFILFTYNKRSVMSSGVLIDSLAACRKIIAPDCGAFTDMAKQHSFVYLYKDFSDIASLCRDHYTDYALNYEEVCSFVARNSWYNMGQKIKELADRDSSGSR
jgi:glycosyltransferase involved in cell wall biosynthesis